MFKDTKNKDAAIAFTEYLMDPDRNLQFIKDRGFLPIYTAQFALPEFQTGPIKAFTDALPKAKFVPLNANWTQFDKIGTNAITAMLLEKSGAGQGVPGDDRRPGRNPAVDGRAAS